MLNEINSTFPEANVHISDNNREEGLAVNFDDIPYPDLRPRFRGCSTSRDQYENWTTNMQAPLTTSADKDIPSRTLEAFKEKIESAVEMGRNKSKARKKERQVENIVKRQDMSRMLTRTQRYLGLISKGEESLMPDISTLSVADVNVNELAPHPFDNDVIFISVDVEAWEDPPNPITEVGVATLDSRDLRQHAPGPNGEQWQKLIRARHFRIDEYKTKRNHKYLDGCPDKFEFNNHASTLVPNAQISKTVTACFNPPYSASSTQQPSLETRKVVLVGHDINADITYLRQLGISLANFSCITDTIDTAALFRACTRDPNGRCALGHVLAEHDLQGWHLHNAGNDAVYTLWAMLAICVKNSTVEGSREMAEKRERSLSLREESAVEAARERVREECVGWEGTGDDGGAPVSLTEGRVDGRRGTRVLFTAGGNVLDV